MKKILIVFGTRPEAIKMIPLIFELKKFPELFETRVCVSAQHREMLDSVLDFFAAKPDYDFNIMSHDQSLFNITSRILTNIEEVLDEFNPHLVFVQGDTTTTFTVALAAFYKKIKVAHLEAGLRSNNKYSPFPEEVNRKLTSNLADFHFAPTIQNKTNLHNEGIIDNVWVVGNTVIDALFLGLQRITADSQIPQLDSTNIDYSKRIILVTGHRRESFGEPFKNICKALKQIAENHNVEIVYPVHLNPNVRKPVNDILSGISNVHLIEPLDYPDMIKIMNHSYLVLTDSGGIQEEAPSLGKPVLVMRDVTERIEGIEAGTAMLVGTETQKIYDAVQLLLNDPMAYNKMSEKTNPYGDGSSAEKIVEILKTIL